MRKMNNNIKTVPRFVVFSDFDRTITLGDTCSSLVHESVRNLHQNDSIEAENRSRKWKDVSTIYMNEYNKITETNKSLLCQRYDSNYFRNYQQIYTGNNSNSHLTLEEQRKAAYEYLSLLSPVEHRGLHLTEQNAILSGLTPEQIRDLGKTIKLRPYALDTILKFSQCPTNILFLIVSANWTYELLNGCIHGNNNAIKCCHVNTTDPTPEQLLNPSFFNSTKLYSTSSSSPSSSSSYSTNLSSFSSSKNNVNIPICCNKLEYDPRTSLSTGRVNSVIVGPQHKQFFLRNAMNIFKANWPRSNKSISQDKIKYQNLEEEFNYQQTMSNSFNLNPKEYHFHQSQRQYSLNPKYLKHDDEYLNPHESQKTKRPCFSVYIGDSLFDLLALLEADIGIIVGDSMDLAAKDTEKKESQLLNICDILGIHLKPLIEWDPKNFIDNHYNHRHSSPATLYYTNNWQEINQSLSFCCT